VSFGGLREASPLLAVLNAVRARDPAPEAGAFGEPTLDLQPSAAAPSTSGTPIVYDPTAGPPLTPIQSALQAATERLIARADRRNPLGAGDWRAARRAVGLLRRAFL